MAKSKATLKRERELHEMDRLETVRLLYETLMEYSYTSSGFLEDDEDDEDDEDFEILKGFDDALSGNPELSDSVGVSESGEMISAAKLKMMALAIMHRSLKILSE